MNLQYCSDLHLEFRENRDFLKRVPLQPKGDILLLAGDIAPLSMMKKINDFLDFVSANFHYVYWLPGNHEYYHSDALRSGGLHEKIRSNVFLVNNISFQHDHVKFIFSTLWSRINPANQLYVQQYLNDFRMIGFKGHLLSVADFNRLHLQSLKFIKEEIGMKGGEKAVVISHHVPTFCHYPKKYIGDSLNEAFAVELFALIEGSGINYWIYGHHHHNTADFLIGKTQLVTNQLGYVCADEHRLFDPSKMIIL